MKLSVLQNFSNMSENSKFLLIIIGIISFLLLLIFLINFISERKNRRQARQKKKLIKEINKAAKDIVPEKKEIVKKQVQSPATQNIAVKQEQEETLEIEPEEIIEVLQEDNESDVDRILRDIKKASKEETINLNEFEREQEETAIISYDELCKRAGVKKKVYKAVTEETMDVSKIVPEINEKKKFKPTTYVSPIFGAQKDKALVEEDLDKTFLQNLKEFRSTLDM